MDQSLNHADHRRFTPPGDAPPVQTQRRPSLAFPVPDPAELVGLRKQVGQLSDLVVDLRSAVVELATVVHEQQKALELIDSAQRGERDAQW